MNKKISYFLLTGLIIITGQFNTAYASLSGAKKQAVLEVVIFTVNARTSPSNVRKLALSITPVLKKYPGFISRKLAENTQISGQYIDIVKWKSLKDADFAADNIIANKKMKQFIAIMQSYKIYHFKFIT